MSLFIRCRAWIWVQICLALKASCFHCTRQQKHHWNLQDITFFRVIITMSSPSFSTFTALVYGLGTSWLNGLLWELQYWPSCSHAFSILTHPLHYCTVPFWYTTLIMTVLLIANIKSCRFFDKTYFVVLSCLSYKMNTSSFGIHDPLSSALPTLTLFKLLLPLSHQFSS